MDLSRQFAFVHWTKFTCLDWSIVTQLFLRPADILHMLATSIAVPMSVISSPVIYDRVSRGGWSTHWDDFNFIGSDEKPLMSDESLPPPFASPPTPWIRSSPGPYRPHYGQWLNERPPRTSVLSLGEGCGWFIGPLLGSRKSWFRKKPLTFAEAPYMAVDAAYGIFQGGQFVYPCYGAFENIEHRWRPDIFFIEKMQTTCPHHYRHATFQNLDLCDLVTGARLMFDEIVARRSLGYVLRETWEKEGFQTMKQILDRVLLHLKSEGRVRINGFIVDDEPPLSFDELFFDDLETLLKMYISSGQLRAYNINFRHMPYHQLILIGPDQ